MQDRRKLLTDSVCLTVLLLGPRSAHTHEVYPSRPVRILVGVSPGGVTDLLARFFAQTMGAATTASFVVENRPGAGGTLAADAVARSAPDGYTLVAASSTAIVTAPHLYKHLGYVPLTDLKPVTLLGAGPLVLAVHGELPARTVADLLHLARAKPHALAFGSGGLGSAGHLTMEMFAARAGIQLVHSPYKGDGQAVHDLLRNEVQLMFTAHNQVDLHVKAGRLRLLAVSQQSRLDALPQVPTVAECDPAFAGFESFGWIGLFAPAKTPPEIIQSLAATWQARRRGPDVERRLRALGMDFISTPKPEAFAAFIGTEVLRWSQVIATAGLKPQ